ncbi:MAG: peptidoglycan DL-endopeptidase CwlO [Gemmatimonadales bacterium]|nr:peptidoglycan DL-endopeptidase CwlO [Gemmatimonadales bacterium]
MLALVLAPCAGTVTQLEAQDAEASIGRLFDSTGWTSYRLGVTRPLRGVFRVQLHGNVLRRVGGVGTLAGVGTDLTAFRSGGQGPYLVAGLSGGLGSESANSFSDLWGSWSAGAGYDLFPASFMSIGAEGRWRGVSLTREEGVELTLGLALHLGRAGLPRERGRPPVQPGGPLLVPETVTSSSPPYTGPRPKPETLADSIIATATDVMGRPYTYGGTGAEGEGFDCSGLIQYAYRKHGVALPRRSTDQAREGRKIDRELKRLAPADILTFSNRGGRVTHVGLYIGEGRFIHSATRGVQVSTLSAEDPYGRWWYKRWVGVRRIVR